MCKSQYSYNKKSYVRIFHGVISISSVINVCSISKMLLLVRLCSITELDQTIGVRLGSIGNSGFITPFRFSRILNLDRLDPCTLISGFPGNNEIRVPMIDKSDQAVSVYTCIYSINKSIV